MIEFWLRWNCDFCYPSHAKSLFSLPRNPPKRRQNLFKKILCNQTPPKSSVFRPGRPWMASWTEKGSKRDPKIEPPGRPTSYENQWFWGVPPPLPLPKSPKASISEALLINFEPFLTVSNPFLSTCFSLVCTCSRNDSQWFNNCVKDIDTLKKSTMGNHFETEETQGKLES